MQAIGENILMVYEKLITLLKNIVIMKTENNNQEQQNLFPLTPRQFFQFATHLTKKIKAERFWKIENTSGKQLLLLDSKTQLLWPLTLKNTTNYYPDDAKNIADKYQDSELTGWKLPTKKEMCSFSHDSSNPLRAGGNNYLFSTNYFAVVNGRCQLYYHEHFDQGGDGAVFPIHSFLVNNDSQALITMLTKKEWQLTSYQTGKKLVIKDQAQEYLQDLDYSRARLPKIENTQFTDPNKGMWEFYNNDLTAVAAKQGIKSRNPALDVIKHSYVGIDFGTSSTVVSFMEKGEGKLLRVGVQDFYKPIEQKHFENPTVLEFIDIPELLSAWQSEAYKPEVNWDHVHCSHEAQTRFRDNDGDTQVLASVLTKMKQWAFRTEEENQQVTVVGFNNQVELPLDALTLRKPVKGQALEVSGSDPFDPIELYAWFLGLNINWRQRGLFLKYLMTFPVDYSKQVKEKILASFSRGLQRSLPKELIEQDIFDTFSVEERASEPAAYAASALPALGIEPTEEGVAYAVFDFGGGTADFDFGIYRLATEEEEDDHGYEQVFEHYAVAGDRFLGGENLLENMAYQTFQHNLEVCRSNRIAFTCPLDAKSFSGSEMFIDRTQAAQTNTQMMIAKLRPLWEQGDLAENSLLKVSLLDRNGKKVACEFQVDQKSLQEYMESRITQGIHNFYRSIKSAFDGKSIDHVDILLAGNSSQSEWVSLVFSDVDPSVLPENEDEDEDEGDEYFNSLFDGNAPSIKVHLPLKSDDNNPHAPTCKTGVALGLLSLRPGSSTKVINHVSAATKGEAPFAFHVGQIKRGKFSVGLKQSATYQCWHQIGVVRERMFELYATQSANAIDNNLPSNDPSLVAMMFEFVGNTEKHKVFARATGPKEVEICTAPSVDLLNSNAENVQIVSLV
ncbi:hypothetical protein [uncultured Shewanella sp.]|uniref:hypothetical protein n=1 Tax=uncultured Shewanella sp. TaxID=173975 RepID=UPI0026095275|nr:hypothetical protein [uncultured Shewanella sp.]